MSNIQGNNDLPRRDCSGTGAVSRQALLFGLFGGVQILVDWATFVLLTWVGVGTASSNMAGRVVGASLGYWLNGRFTFNWSSTGRPRSGARVVRFILGWAITAALSTAAVYLIERSFGLHAAWVAKFIVDGAIAVFGFVLSKYWIFR